MQRINEVSNVALLPEVAHACWGIQALGICTYNPGAPFAVYFGLGEAVGALGFTLAVQQLLKPIYRFRVEARFLSLPWLYSFVFAGVFAIVVATLVPQFPMLSTGPLGYPILWEMIGALLFVIAYAAVVLAIIKPVSVRTTSITKFAQMSADLLSSADEQDHIDYAMDLESSLPTLIKTAAFADYSYQKSAFFHFTYRKKIDRGAYASSFLRIIADPEFCATLTRRSPWRVARMLLHISANKLYARGAEQFVRELGRQAILQDNGMMAREIGYHGFGTAPVLSDRLFSDPFIVNVYNSLDSFTFLDTDAVTSEIVKRFNSAAERCYVTLITSGSMDHSQAAYSVERFYRSVFSRAWNIQQKKKVDYHLPLEMHFGVTLAIKMADKLLEKVSPEEYEFLYVIDPKKYRSDVLETLVEIVYEALAGISNRFKGFDDAFWTTGIEVFQRALPSIGQQPDGLSPFQQRLTLKIMDKLRDNMNGFYPAICRVLLACVGPYERNVDQANRTAFNILKDAMYCELKRLPELAANQREKITHFLPPNVTYNFPTAELTHIYRGGDQVVTNLSTLDLKPISLVDLGVRRRVDV